MADDYEKLVQEYKQKNKRAFVLGYTGACGKELVEVLLSSNIFAKVVLIGRRTVTYEDQLYKDVEQRVVDFENLDQYADAFKNFDVGYCCLGVTRGKSGTEGYIRVDHDYVVNAAQLAKQGGCSQFHLISSTEAHKDSSFMYLKNKGETEEEVKAMGFESLIIYRPAFLLATRQDTRLVEIAVKVFLRPVIWMFPTFMTVPVETVAKAMLNKTLTPATDAVEILENDAIHRVGAD